MAEEVRGSTKYCKSRREKVCVPIIYLYVEKKGGGRSGRSVPFPVFFY